MSDVEIQIVLPATTETVVERGLRLLTWLLNRRGLAEAGHGILGGYWGYGANYENAVFMFHRYCWCEREDCPWCGGCICPGESYDYVVDGKEVTAPEWDDAFQEAVRGLKTGSPAWYKAADAINARRKTIHTPVCDFCLGKGVFATHGAEPGRGAPHFWHKPSGLKIWWYKYIGRDMEYNREVTGEEWRAILRECVKSLSKEARP